MKNYLFFSELVDGLVAPPPLIAYNKKSKINRRVSTPRGYRGKPKRLSIFNKSCHIRRWLLNNPWTQPMTVFNYASIVIQKRVRGYIVRYYIKRNQMIIRKVISSGNNSSIRLFYQFKIKSLSTYNTKSQAQLGKYLKCIDFYRVNSVKKPQWLDAGFSNWCAIRIQSWFRMVTYRRRFLYKYTGGVAYQIACIVIQCAWRAVLLHRYHLKITYSSKFNVNIKSLPARKIQLCWRSFCNYRIYKYFRNIIVEQLKGKPSDLLKAIIPNESCLFDKASGVHVRFRLGGVIFPPKIYFKIFTHRPLCDINAFAPRDYKFEKQINANEVNNNQLLTKSSSSIRVGSTYFNTTANTTRRVGNTNNYYKRDDGNAWRPISSFVLEELDLVPSWLKGQGQKKKQELKRFHFSSIQRKQDMARIKKINQRKWMVKAYMLANGQDTVTATAAIKSNTDYTNEYGNDYKHEQFKQCNNNDGNISSSQYVYPDDAKYADNNNDDDLVKWSQALDFDAYSYGWSNLATSLSS